MNETKSATEDEDRIDFGSYSLTIVFNWKKPVFRYYK